MARILVVDDANFMRVTLGAILKQQKHHIIAEATNGEEAITLYHEIKPDLVTMDITMPVMNGIKAITEIIKADPKAKIVVCSAMGQKKNVVEAIEKGAKDFIAKPFDENRILETINHVLHDFEPIN